ncbi:N-carbamoylputrescine amidase [Oscillospiraceae bacterium MB08-C2-2]|nr:N-carbamoylputrescine amidase [Oscillospiraceae bacterium MB08-C2-2]
MRKIVVAVTQMKHKGEPEENCRAAEALIAQAAEKGANVILLQELFAGPYFCQKQQPKYFSLAEEAEQGKLLRRFSHTARQYGVVLPISFFERRGNAFFNSMGMLDADGSLLGIYRKSHIPDGPGYREKYYFSPGDTGFKIWDTAYGKIGVGICWDQWFPEAARSMALQGAELLLYPTAIGSEPQDPELDSMPHWMTCMQGHAAANLVPVAASNRIGTETQEDGSLTFYGSSFIADEHGQIQAQADRSTESVLTASFDLDEIAQTRQAWGVFRDRRPDLYRHLLTLDGEPVT